MGSMKHGIVTEDWIWNLDDIPDPNPILGDNPEPFVVRIFDLILCRVL